MRLFDVRGNTDILAGFGIGLCSERLERARKFRYKWQSFVKKLALLTEFLSRRITLCGSLMTVSRFSNGFVLNEKEGCVLRMCVGLISLVCQDLY